MLKCVHVVLTDFLLENKVMITCGRRQTRCHGVEGDDGGGGGGDHHHQGGQEKHAGQTLLRGVRRIWEDTFLLTYQHSHIECDLKIRSVPKGCFQLNGPCYRAVNLLSSLDVSEEFRKWDGPTSALGRGLERGTVKFDSETSRTGFFAKVR